MANKDFEYTYFMKRKGLGKQPMFCETRVVLIDSIYPDKNLQKTFCLRNPVNNTTQTCINVSEDEVNTKQVFKRNYGMNHAEGGWPKEINCEDEEATFRHRRKYERDEDYVNAIINTYPKLKYYTDQNNAIEMYNLYFKDMEPVEPVEKSTIKVTNVFVDPDQRPISCISWTSDQYSKLAVSYCNKMYPNVGLDNKNHTGYIWNLENSKEPYASFAPPSACWQVVCVPKSPNIIIGGLEDGRVCLFDLRAQQEPVALCPMHLTHRESVSALAFIHSRVNVDFFSGSTEGKCMWWDLRNLHLPQDSLIMSIRCPPGESISLANSEGVSALQYDKSFPTKFLCGTMTGFVINVNRKGKTHNDVMNAIYETHNGPVKAVHRSPCTSKVFITCGDYTTHIWSDDVRVAPIVTGTAHRYQINDVVWAPRRVSSYMTVSADGKFRYWDFLRKYREPSYSLTVSENQLLKMTPHDSGRFVAIGDIKGRLFVLSLSENLIVSADNDKQRMLQCLDREGRREHILETRIKEIKLLKMKAGSKTALDSTELILDDPVQLQEAEDEYKKIVMEEFRRAGAPLKLIRSKAKLRRR